ncbi:MAG: hypothetical protein IJC58_08065 [Oscillospiraceae bacterium]|nr:hypothetical protein [Oscillospiraceae bacterium]
MYEKKVLKEKKGLGIIVAVLAVLGTLLRVMALVQQNYFAWLRTAFEYGYPQEKILVVSLLLGNLVAIVGFILLAVAALRGMPLFVPYIVVIVGAAIPLLRLLLIGGGGSIQDLLVLVLEIAGSVLAIVACISGSGLRYGAMGLFFASGVVELLNLFLRQQPYFSAMMLLYTVVPIVLFAAAYGLAMLFAAPEAAGRPPMPPYGYAPYGQMPPQYGQSIPPQYQQPQYQPPQYQQSQYQQSQYQPPVQPTVPQAPAVPQPPAEE